MPIMLFDPAGNLLYYNEPAETILGRRFDETGEMSLEEWYALFELTAENGSPVPLQVRPWSLPCRSTKRRIARSGCRTPTAAVGASRQRRFPWKGRARDTSARW
jgi:hypothetical protein